MQALRIPLRRVGRLALLGLLAAALLGAVVAGDRAVFTWPASSGPVDHYEAEVSFDGGSTWEALGVTPDAATRRIELGAAFGDEASVRVRAVAADGRTSDWSTPSEAVRFVEPLGIPSAPEVNVVCAEGTPGVSEAGVLVCE